MDGRLCKTHIGEPQNTHASRIAVLRMMALVIAATATTCTFARAQPASAPLTPEQRELVKVQIKREQAQAKFYLEQIEHSRRQAEVLAAQQKPKSFWQKVTNDPADTVGAAGVVLGAFVIFLILAFNSEAARRDRRDIQFYEALKRFGDESSPATRCSAAALLTHMGKQREFKLRARKGWLRWESPYFETALGQLSTRLQLEENAAVLDCIRHAIGELAGRQGKSKQDSE